MQQPTAPTPTSLCPGCLHVRRVQTRRSVFLLCQRSRYDAAYARYPRQPVLACPGYEAAPTSEAPPGGAGRGPEG